MMKKEVLLLLLALISALYVASQAKTEFGLTTGYFYGIADIKLNEVDITDNFEYSQGNGALIGFLADIPFDDKFSLQPEFLYVFGGERGALLLPILIKYQPVNKFNVLLGAQLDMFLNVPSNFKQYVNTLGLGVAAGFSYDITKKITIHTKYSYGLTERFNNKFDDFIVESLEGFIELSNINTSFKANSFQIGLSYKF